MFFSPPDFERYGLGAQGLAAEIRRGLDRVEGIRVRLVADLVRDTGPAQATRTLERIAEVREYGVIGIGLGGSENDFPAEAFAEVFAAARRLGFCTSAHAGEVAGAESVWAAVRDLKVDRVGHATRATEDEELLEHLESECVPLELCPISNVKTGAIPSLEAHPVRAYFDRGMAISVNTDDPKMFGNSLADEYVALVRHHGFTADEIGELMVRTIRSTWLDPAGRAELEHDVLAAAAWTEM